MKYLTHAMCTVAIVSAAWKYATGPQGPSAQEAAGAAAIGRGAPHPGDHLESPAKTLQTLSCSHASKTAFGGHRCGDA